jgi:nucleoside-diphosphate-sugar epimerase/SAM-dependent methyltransferase
MKKIVITGGLGYIGMELCKIYSGKSRKYQIKVIDKNFYSSRVSQLKRWGISFSQVDILDSDRLSHEISDADVIFHLAGVTNVATTSEDINISRDKKVREVGIKGTRNIIKHSKKDVKIIFPSTHVVFEGLDKVINNIKETFLPKPVLEYSNGKVQSEKDLISSGKDYVILRLGSVYGNSQDSTRLNIMPNLFSKISSVNGEIKLFGGGKQLKSLVSVVDVARCMKFVETEQNINNEIYHCINEQLTVKQVANICKKLNKNLKISITKDTIPNLGYSLSNDKIKKAGFRFLYKIEPSIREMVESWTDKPTLLENEDIQEGKDNYIDERGIISNYYFDDYLNMIGYVESKKGTQRGDHYHPIQTQKCLLIKGQYISITKDLSDENSVVETRLINPGDLSTIPPYVAHTMVFLEDSIFLNLVNGEREHNNYGVTHTIPHKLVDEKLFNNLLDSYVTSCRVCGGGLSHYLSLGLSPLANNLNDKKSTSNDVYPLDMNFCKKCSNSQLSVVVPPEKMFDNYFYLSSTSQKFRDHFVDFSNELKSDLKLKNSSVVVDIGSNDGIFLDPIKNLGMVAIGVEPAKNVAKIANSKKLTTLPEYFSHKTVNKIIKKYGKVDVVTAFNVFAHGDGLKEILKNTENLLKKNGEFIFEIQYLLRTLKDVTFDNIYHEHVNYWCLLAILNFFEDSEMKVYKVKEVDTHGGSLRVYATKNKNKRMHKSVGKYIQIEKKSKLDEYSTYLKFAKKVHDTKKKSLAMIKDIKLEEKKIIGYGAPAKATTILNYFGLSEKDFLFTIDENSLKQNKFIPGTNIEIKDINEVKPGSYDYVLVLAWNFFDTIKSNNKSIFSNSKFIKLK